MTPLHIGMAIFVAFVWGINFVVAKFGMTHYPALVYLALRFFFMAIPAIFFIPRPTKWRYILGAGIFTGTCHFALAFGAIYLGASVGVSALLLQTQVFFTAAISALWLKEYVQRHEVIGMCLAFFGIALISFSEEDSSITWLTLIMLLLSALAFALGNLVTRKMGKVSVFPFLVWMSLIPIIPLSLLSMLFEHGQWAALTTFNLGALLSIAYVVLVSTLIGFGIWNYLLRLYPAGKIAPFLLLVPVFGAISAAIFYQERLHFMEWIGASVLLMGLSIHLFAKRLRAIKQRP